MAITDIKDLINNDSHVEDACDSINAILKRFDYDPISKLALHIATLCNVDTADIFSSRDKSSVAQARWLLWYAYRQATNETYEMIAKRSEFNGSGFCPRAVAAGIDKMYYLITHEDIWQKRWLVIKSLIRKKTHVKKETSTVVVNIPQELKGKVNVQIIEK